MQFPIEGSVSLSNGSATLRLKPASVEVVYGQAPRPTVEDVQLWDVHSSRLPMNKKVLASAMVCVQKTVGHPHRHQWSMDPRCHTQAAGPTSPNQRRQPKHIPHHLLSWHSRTWSIFLLSPSASVLRRHLPHHHRPRHLLRRRPRRPLPAYDSIIQGILQSI